MNKYLTIDKYTLSRETMASIIYDLDEGSIVYEAESLIQASHLDEVCHSIDIVISHPEQSHLGENDYFTSLQNTLPNAKFMLISGVQNYSLIKPFIDSGAHAVISVSSTRNEFVTAIRSLKSNQPYIGECILKSRALNEESTGISTYCSENTGKSAKREKLTARQCQVLDCITKGYANKLIAYELGVTEGTVKLHVSSILRALNVTNRTEAALRGGQILNGHYMPWNQAC